MKLLKSQLLAAAGLALVASTASADPLHPGFYIGGNSGASFVTNQASGKVSIYNKEEHDSIRAAYMEENSIRGYNAGVFAGWNFYCDERWYHGVEVSWDFFSNRGRAAHDLQFANVKTFDSLVAAHDWETLPDDVDVKTANFEEIYDLEWAVNLVFKPGVKVSDNTVFYGIVGASWASLDTQSSRISSDRRRGRGGDSLTVSHNEEEGHHRRNKDHGDDDDLWGFVLGAGLSTQVTHYLSVFGSYQYTYYGKSDLGGFREVISDHHGGPHNLAHNDHTDPAFVHVRDREARIDTNVFKIGLAFNF